MSEQESLDLGKVVSLIMENPALIEQISALAKQSPTQTEPKAEVSTESQQNRWHTKKKYPRLHTPRHKVSKAHEVNF